MKRTRNESIRTRDQIWCTLFLALALVTTILGLKTVTCYIMDMLEKGTTNE